ncbi:diamine N-acetyltransferase [Burkholderiales bacterium]|nr:MAG: GNAT family N-acetyltransferase [Burkholderiales bacterium]CAG0985566.1 diamine N-acetyltransferase [Burkholderiales bacterium]
MPLAKKRSRTASSKAAAAAPAGKAAAARGQRIRPVEAEDLDQVIAIDTEITGIEKVDYWYELFHRYGLRSNQQRLFLVAEDEGVLQGYIIGEVRDWEFGSPPCGWVFGINVRPETREGGIGSKLLDAICVGFKRAGVTKVRTMLARDNGLIMSFFRSQGMMAAPFIALERDLD